MLCVCFWNCSPFATTVPDKYEVVENYPLVYPDYIGVTIPCNIAPLTFRREEEGREYVTRFVAGENEYVVAGKEVAVSVEKWKEMLAIGANWKYNETNKTLRDKIPCQLRYDRITKPERQE